MLTGKPPRCFEANCYFAVVIETSQASVYSQDMIRTLFK